MSRIAIVTPWFGSSANGGAESHARELARRFAAGGDEVHVLTTCSPSFFSSWDVDEEPAGTTRDESGVVVTRFPLDARDRTSFDAVNARLLALSRKRYRELQREEAQTAPFIDQSINSSALIEHLRGEGDDFDAVIALPYLFGVVVRAIEALRGRAHLMPCLHDEAYAHLPAIRRAFHNAASLLFLSEGEAELALRTYGPGILHKSHVVGAGVEPLAIAAGVLPEGVGDDPFVLYLGRRDVTKGVDDLVAAHELARSRGDAVPQLVLAGPGDHSYADGDGIVDLGFVDEGAVGALLREAVGLVQPSRNESYSRVLMQAWLARKPVVVNAACLATSVAVANSGGGFIASGSEDWASALVRLGSLDVDARDAFGSAGARYAAQHADWGRAIDRVRDATGIRREARSHVSGRRVDQVVQTLEYGDAISDYAVHVRDRLIEIGHASTIYAEAVGPLVLGQAQLVDSDSFDRSDAVIYHHSIGSAVTETMVALTCPKALVYHNITPEEFFRPYVPWFADLLKRGRDALPKTIEHFDVLVADSNFNADELHALGRHEVFTVAPLVDFRRFDRMPDAQITAREGAGARWLFVGRVAPNKGLARLIAAFAAYRAVDRSASLSIVGRYDAADPYYRELLRSVVRGGLGYAIRFEGMVDEAQLLAFYQTADVYVCMSEHEGFCVPLVEAMFFELPLVALATSAVPETVGEGGILIESAAAPEEIAAVVRVLLTDDAVRGAVVDAQRSRRRSFLPSASNAQVDALAQRLLA